MTADAIPITGVWIRRIGPNVELLVEVDGKWRRIATEAVDGSFSTIVEPGGMRTAEIDEVTR